ncbi:MAG: hypothetical protein JXB32_18540 [Deltaproteobacteria bacterium]|nr:hypothetical protein [Deltaproteobacteria bacterium]
MGTVGDIDGRPERLEQPAFPGRSRLDFLLASLLAYDFEVNGASRRHSHPVASALSDGVREVRPAKMYDGTVMALNSTAPSKLVDEQARPYFLWDTDLSVDEFRVRLSDPDPRVAAYLHGKLMRQAKPDDVFLFTTRARIRELWPQLERYLGRSRGFWRWILARWDADERTSQ